MASSSPSNASGDVELSVICEYNTTCHVFGVNKLMKLSDIYNILSRRWSHITPENIIVKYLTPSTRMQVSLIEDSNVSSMCHIHYVMKKEVIDMVLESKIQPREDAREDPGIGTSRSAPVENEDYDNMDDLDDNATGVETTIIRRGLIKREGQCFRNAEHFRAAIKDYCIAHNRDYIFKKNDSIKIIAKCTMKSCPWRVYAAESKREGTFSIRKCNLIHTCDNGLGTRGHPKVTSSWVCKKIKKKLRSMPRYRPIEIMTDIHKKYGVLLKYYQAWHGKETTMREIHGLDHLSYDKLEPYCRALKLANPGTIADYEIFDDTRRFHRIFISLGACIKGFHAGCRPMIFMDGTHIKHKYQGCLLSATAKDANNGIFTISFAIVQQENDESWWWFCGNLRRILSYPNGSLIKQYTFYSDRQPGCIKAVEDWFPECHHTYCLRHLVDNLKKQVLTIIALSTIQEELTSEFSTAR